MAGAVTISKTVAIVLVCVTFVAGLALLFVPEKEAPEPPVQRHEHTHREGLSIYGRWRDRP